MNKPNIASTSRKDDKPVEPRDQKPDPLKKVKQKTGSQSLRSSSVLIINGVIKAICQKYKVKTHFVYGQSNPFVYEFYCMVCRSHCHK
jgi:hypothetical protein